MRNFVVFAGVLVALSGCAVDAGTAGVEVERVGQRPGALRGGAKPGGGTRTSPTQVVLEPTAFTVEQIDFLDDGGMSAWGALSIDPTAVARQTGVGAGFVSVRSSLGWVVYNLPVQSRPEADWPARVQRQGLRAPSAVPPVRTYFDLGTASPLRALDLAVIFSSEPLGTARDLRTWEKAKLVPIVVSATQQTLPKGFAVPPPDGIPPAPPPAPPVLAPEPIDPELGLAGWYTVSLPAEDNVQSAWNQCGPVAYANALAYLRSTFGLAVPHQNVRGVNGGPALVGMIDLLSQRPATDNCNGSPIDYCIDGSALGGMFNGLYSYLDAVGLSDAVTLEHQGVLGDLPQACDDTITEPQPFSTASGGAVTVDWIRGHLEQGDAVVLAFNRLTNTPGGEVVTSGHMLRIYGYTEVNGQDFLMALDDQQQDGMNNGGCVLRNDGLTWETWAVGDSDGDGTLNKGLNDLREISFAMALGVP